MQFWHLRVKATFELDPFLTLSALIEDHFYYGNKTSADKGEKITEFPTKILFARTYECEVNPKETRDALWKILLDCSRLATFES